jgi:hypothetical protein
LGNCLCRIYIAIWIHHLLATALQSVAPISDTLARRYSDFDITLFAVAFPIPGEFRPVKALLTTLGGGASEI